MSDSDDFTAMDDPEFLAEYKRVRDTIEALSDRMRKLTKEFDRRTAAQWGPASRGQLPLPRFQVVEALLAEQDG
jgi:hypothetical protein